MKLIAQESKKIEILNADNTFANANMSSGWLTKKKNGQTIFTPKVYK